MSRPFRSSRLPWLAGAILVALLALLGILQLRWLGEVAAADRQRLDAAARTALGTLAGELDRELSRAWLAFSAPRGLAADQVAPARQRWRDAAPHPELLADLVLIGRRGEAPRQLDAAGRWVAATGAAARLATQRPPGRGRRPPHLPRLRPDLPGFQVPVVAADGEPAALLVVLDRRFLVERVLPRLVEHHLVPLLGDGVAVAVRERSSGTLVWASPPDAAGPFAWQVPLFRLLPGDELRRLAFATGWRHQPAHDHPGRAEGPPWRGRRAALAADLAGPGGWVLQARPAAGSLGAALARARTGNAALVLGILLLLALAALALALSARRAQAMAARQIEFTATVSHELRTPIAAIHSLAENLADGLVRDPAQTRLYGEQIARQSGRLAEMVEQVLLLAAEERQRRDRPRHPVDLAALAREAAEEARQAHPGAEVEIDLPPALPPIAGQPLLLRRAVHNLVANALKHGGSPPRAWVRIAADGEVARVEVRDRGPGVPAGDHEKIFAPFYRGRRAVEGQLAGAGLGLHLVRRAAAAHGGSVELASTPAAGATFTLVLPLAAAPPEGGREEP